MSEMRWGRYPGPVWTLIAWAVLNGLNLLFAITFPANGKHPDVVTVGTVVYAAFVTVLLLAMADRTPMWLVWAILSGAIVSSTLLIYGAVTPLGGALFALPYIVYTSYAALWGSRRLALAYLVAAGLAYLAVLQLRHALPQMLVSWLVIMSICTGLVLLLSQLVSDLRRLATTDPLTGLLNRQGLTTLLELSPQQGRRTQPRTVIVFDLDRFKRVNDTAGHLAGDAVLAGFAEALQASARSDDILARTGGDEFMAVLPLSGEAQVGRFVQRVREATPTPFSYGAAEWPPEISYDEVTARADERMYGAKRNRAG